ncbi:hypothetical protein P389DRAFT_4199 [Cystobasidium minutum MCA 4210]|uniref:uncharacterized protein n=1 Tax=Cystobasidium minutum MCA 4210 TaxID=1397322 RepID=UPI0034CE4881|eukprot:jgi/Rhomi1/4199/CE4198_676
MQELASACRPLLLCTHGRVLVASRASRQFGKARFASSSSTTSKDTLQGSVSPHARHLVIFSGRKYDTLPSHINTTSRLYEQIVERMQDAESPLSKMALAVTDASHPCTSPPEKKWNGKANRFDEPERGPDAEDESYGAVVYPDRVSLPFPITQESVENRILEGFLHGLPSRSIAEKIEDKTTTELVTRTSPEIDVYVCTHGARDCRCGDIGSAFYDALVFEAKRRGLGNAAHTFGEGKGPIRIHRTTHIGGHRYAATCFTSTGDWYGLLSPLEAGTFLDYMVKVPDQSRPLAHVWWEKWRGRAGLSQDAQITLAEEGFQQQHLKTSALEAAQTLKRMKKKRKAIALGDPVDLVFNRHDGEKVPVRAFMGETLMDCAKRYELVEATCGGACECATCHVYLLPKDEGGPLPPVPETSDEEEDQLEYAIGATDDSRLACQVLITEELVKWLKEGGSIKLPRY